MKVLFYASDKPREIELAKAFAKGARRHGAETEIRPLVAQPSVEGFDAVAMVGVKSKRLFEIAKAAGVVQIMLDKGYIRSRRADARTWEYWRHSVGSHHPTHNLMDQKRKSNRREALGLQCQPWRRRGLQIVIAGSSAKYHSFYDLPEPNQYYRDLVEKIKALTDRPIVYRPKPSFKDAEPIKGTYLSRDENIVASLQGAWALVTHGSNSCFEAALSGVPSIILGDGVAAPISSTSLEDLAEPRLGKRDQWLANLCYHQWTEAEMAAGYAWKIIGEQINGHKGA